MVENLPNSFALVSLHSINYELKVLQIEIAVLHLQMKPNKKCIDIGNISWKLALSIFNTVNDLLIVPKGTFFSISFNYPL